MEKPDIFDYSDFRLYLKDLFEFKNSENPKFTKSHICRALGQENSRSLFHGILNGRFLSASKLALMVEAFEMGKAETKYFRVMVNFNQAFDDPEERDLCFEQLLTLKKAEGREVDSSKYEYYSKWYHSAIRSLLNIINVSDNLTEIKRALIPSLSTEEIRDSLTLLKKLELIHTTEEGFLKPSEQMIRTPEYCRDATIVTYQNEVLGQAQKLTEVKETDSTLRKKTLTKMLTFSLSAQERVEEAISRFNNEINAIVSEDKEEADRLYQMIVTLFPYSKGVQK